MQLACYSSADMSETENVTLSEAYYEKKTLCAFQRKYRLYQSLTCCEHLH